MVTWENTFKEIEDARPDVVVLPIGALEQHSLHMPMGTDFILAQESARRIAERLPSAYLLPALPFSNSQEHQDFAGTVWIRPATLAAVLEDICLALRHQGIRKVVVVNGHGGNWILKPAVREINLNHRDMKVIFASAGALASGTGQQEELHAGESECSRLLAVAPHLVKEERVDFIPKEGREFLDYVGVRKVSPTGVWGRATRATREKGEKALEEGVARMVAYITETFRRLEEMEKATRNAERGTRNDEKATQNAER